MSRAMKAPGPDHPITFGPAQRHIRVLFKGRTVAESRRALALDEASYPTVYYLPIADADRSLLQPTDTTTWCPYKGDASYYSLNVDGEVARDAVWTYEQPFPAVAAIKDHIAFYPDRVDDIEVMPLEG